ncbi:molybdenum cofactor guanylyltransferase MobA [Halopseudomonas nanhaiensis]|uniref:molybdenum cofactor guanylyltransferase MobA n=1 Tax=Halopseudomonas nanhaiensis TaxID=2830842 RepID=UPI001CBA99D7|nr:molybdenum cofactor guanylyltransferase MobA [Halopseudomonas nanhaiensis]UAW97314.1 molybdenum cofactor guanylyltransferase MobA [Halopseudomonas nanhaiensis]
MTLSDSFTLSAVLLAGGQGSRLGGRDKGLMDWHGQPVAQRLAARLRSVAAPIMISCNRNQEQYRQWADALVTDDVPDFPGPLAGILGAIRLCRTSHLLVIPCDLPQLPPELLEDLASHARQEPECVWLVRTGEHWQPLVSIIPASRWASLSQAWKDGQRSPLRWLLAQSHRVLQLPEGDPRLHNANTPEDWLDCSSIFADGEVRR